MRHGLLLSADPPGVENRRWLCGRCGTSGTLDEIREQPCHPLKEGTPATDAELRRALTGERS